MQTSLKCPEAYKGILEDLRELKLDGCNPNVMTVKQKEETWKSLKKHGWVVPIITNKDGLIANGEQRVNICLAHEEFYGPVLRLPVSEIDRLMLRQILNKLHGHHKKAADLEEYEKIIKAGEEENLKLLLKAIGEPLPELLQLKRESTVKIPEIFEIIIECKDEEYQKNEFEKLKEQGYKCRVLIL